MKPSILFINPASVCTDHLPIPPLGILYLAAYLRQHFYKVGVLDNNYYKFKQDRLAREMRDYDVIGITGTTAQYKEACEIARTAKENDKVVVAGGPHFSATPTQSIYDSPLDYVVSHPSDLGIRIIWRNVYSN